MEQTYSWAYRVTLELLDGNGVVDGTEVRIQVAHSEQEARARHEAILDTVARPDYTGSKYQRLAGSELLRRPVVEWETVA